MYRHQHLGVLDEVDGSFHIRDLPDDEGAQDRMHNECMTAVRLTLHQVSEARVNWLLAGGVTAQPRNSARADGTVGSLQEAEDFLETRRKRHCFRRKDGF